MKRLASIGLLLAALAAQAIGADLGHPAPKPVTYAKWRVVPFELRLGMSMLIGSTSINDARTSIVIDMKINCTLGPITLKWKAGNGLDAESFGVLSVRSFGIQIADQPEEFHTGRDGGSPDTDDRYFTFGGLSPQRLYGVHAHGNLAVWLPGRGDGFVELARINFSLDGFDRAYDRAIKLCKQSPYSEPWAAAAY